jgi:CRP-like cAMP-binding protein
MASAISISNRLLVALAREDLDPLKPHLKPVPLPHKQILSKADTRIDHVYFPQEGMVSLVQPLENGAMIEVGMIGNEGLVGVPVLLGADTSPLEAMVQIPGSALRMEASAFRQEMGRRTALVGLLLRYVQALHIQVSLSAACNGRHTLPERLARWLLTARDRATSDRMPLSHDDAGGAAGRRHGRCGYLEGRRLDSPHSRPSHHPRPPRLRSSLLRVLSHRQGGVPASGPLARV